MRYYAGIGSRSTPADILALMTRIAQNACASGWTLRSGGADGADSAFAAGSTRSEIFLPWSGFNGITNGIVCGDEPTLRAIAEQHHPAWGACSRGARALHTRNVAQILGVDARTPSQLVVCWTPQGSGSGGTGQALRIAKTHGVPIHDLGLTAVEAKYRAKFG